MRYDCKQPPCLHERIFAGQRTESGISRELRGSAPRGGPEESEGAEGGRREITNHS